MSRLLILMAAFAALCLAADPTGTWKATMESPMGPMENTFTLKMDGANVTGTITSQMGELKIEKGKVDGDKISFEASMDMGTMAYTGTISGNEMKLKMTMGGGDMTMDMVAKKVK